MCIEECHVKFNNNTNLTWVIQKLIEETKLDILLDYCSYKKDVEYYT